MKRPLSFGLILAAGMSLGACSNSDKKETDTTPAKETSVKHVEAKEVTSAAEAKKTFIEKTAEIQSKKTLDANELHDIHMITYTLEQAVAYYTKNLTGERQSQAKEIAVVVEEIHIASENNRKESVQQHLSKYFVLAEKFAAGL